MPNLKLLQLFDIDEKGRTFFNRDVLDSLCDQIGDRPLSVISTAGKFRLGKTFWNNVLLKGLEDGKAHFEPHDLIGGINRIQFKSGFERHTKGIMVWPKVFNRIGKNGEELAVILMDTQGTFDTSSNLYESAIIFAISLLMSSVKIFNTLRQIDSQDLDALNTFIAFSQKTDEKVGQHLVIMIRDAIKNGHANEYLDQMKKNTQKSSELSRLLEGVFEAFEKIDCFMVPRPSAQVINATSEIAAGDCGDDFLETLCSCANYLLDNLTAKTVMGTPLTGKTLGPYVENLVNHIQTSSHSAICSAFAATSELYFEKARSAGNDLFAFLHDRLVRDNNHRPLKSNVYEQELQSIAQSAIELYHSSPSFGTAKEKQKQFDAFKRALEDRCQDKASANQERYRDVQMAEAVNGAYNIYEKAMKQDFASLTKSQKVGVVTEKHEKALPDALAHFEQATVDFTNEPDLIQSKRKLLLEMIEVRYEDLQHDNAVHQMHNQAEVLLKELVDEHSNTLKEFVEESTHVDQINPIIQKCQNLLQRKYLTKKAEFVFQMQAILSKVTSEIIEQMLDNYRESSSADFKKCEDSFERDVRHSLRVRALKEEMEKMSERQMEEQKRYEELENNTTAQLNDLNLKLEVERKRISTESNAAAMTVFLEMMKAMNENSQREMERMYWERANARERESKMEDENERRRQEENKMFQKERAETQQREEQRRIDADRDRQQIQLYLQQMSSQQNMMQMKMMENFREMENAGDGFNWMDVGPIVASVALNVAKFL